MFRNRILVALQMVVVILAGCSGPAQVPQDSGRDAIDDAPRLDAPCIRLDISSQERLEQLGTAQLGSFVHGRRLSTTTTKLTFQPKVGYVWRVGIEMVFAVGTKRIRSTHTETMVFAATAPHALLRAESVGLSDGSDPKHVALEKDSTGWTLTAQQGSFTHRKPIAAVEFTLDDLLGPDVWMSRDRQAGDTITMRELRLEEGKVRPNRYRVLAASREDGMNYAAIDAEGTRQSGWVQDKDRSRVTIGCAEVRQEPVGPVAEYPGLALAASVKIKQPLGDVSGIEQMRVRATGKAAQRLRPGPAQTVEPKADGVLLTLGNSALVRATPEETEAAMLNTFDHPHQHADVQTMLRAALGSSERSRRDTVRQLIAYLQRTMTYDTSVHPDNVIDTIRLRRGSCRHYAELLTTLARAAGIPARKVDGLACGGDAMFGAHAWTEVVLEDGTWLSVDPTFGQMHTATHIRFDPTVEGQTVAMELDQLQLEVVQGGLFGWKALFISAAMFGGLILALGWGTKRREEKRAVG